jgi:hypothetical protein
MYILLLVFCQLSFCFLGCMLVIYNIPCGTFTYAWGLTEVMLAGEVYVLCVAELVYELFEEVAANTFGTGEG